MKNKWFFPILLIGNCIFILLFIVWLGIDIRVTSCKAVKVSTANIIDEYFLYGRDTIYKSLWNKIDGIKNSSLKKSSAQLYSSMTPVAYWWNPLFTYKSKALEALIEISTEQKKWEEVINISHELQSIDPRSPHPFYTAGIAYEELVQTDKAVRSYKEALSRDITHREAARQLVKLYLKLGYDRSAYNVLSEHFQVLDRERQHKDPELVTIFNDLHEKI